MGNKQNNTKNELDTLDLTYEGMIKSLGEDKRIDTGNNVKDWVHHTYLPNVTKLMEREVEII